MKQSIKLRHYVEEIIYGGNDGIVTTFAIISSFVGAGQSEAAGITPALILVLGIASLFADGSSMGLGNFLSIRASSDLLQKGKEKKLSHSMLHGLITFISFVLFGFFPLFPYLILNDNQFVFAWSIFFTFFAFIVLGTVRNRITGKALSQSILENLIVGSVAASIGFVFGYLLRGLV